MSRIRTTWMVYFALMMVVLCLFGCGQTQTPDVVSIPKPAAVVPPQLQRASAAGLLAEQASLRLQGLGISVALSRHLSTDFGEVVQAIVDSDFDRYDRFAVSRGMHLDQIAEGFVEAMVTWKVAGLDSGSGTLNDLPLRERVRALWNDPRARRLEWSQIDPQTVAAGRGAAFTFESSEWPHKGYYSQLSLYAPAQGRLVQGQLEKANLAGRLVWLRFDGLSKRGLKRSTLIRFLLDEESGQWTPISIMISPEDPDVRPFPMI